MFRNVLRLPDLSSGQIDHLVGLACAIRDRPDQYQRDMVGRKLALIFDEPSLRTRVSFETAMYEMGGHALVLAPAEVGLGRRESIADLAVGLSAYIDAAVLRVRHHAIIQDFADAAVIRVINGRSDNCHPCQGIADLMTMRALRGGERLVVAYFGDATAPAARALVAACALAGYHIRVAAPEPFRLPVDIAGFATAACAESGGSLREFDDARDAAAGAQVFYTNSWREWAFERVHDSRRVLIPFRVDGDLIARGANNAIVLHPLPAHRGEEIAADVLDGGAAHTREQARNRLFVEKAILREILGELSG